MDRRFWLKRFVIALSVASLMLLAVRLVKGYPLAAAAQYAVIWGLATAIVFTLAGYIRYRRNPACMLPRSTQE